jgi:hypothetical protein
MEARKRGKSPLKRGGVGERALPVVAVLGRCWGLGDLAVGQSEEDIGKLADFGAAVGKVPP